MINQELLKYIGYTKNSKTLNDIHKELKENRINNLNYSPKYLPMALVTTHEKDSTEIKNIGASIPTDLIMDNFGEWFAKMFKAVTTGSQNVTLVDSGGVNRIIRTFKNFGAQYFSKSNVTVGTGIKAGQSSTAPARTDFELGSLLPSPEGDIRSTTTGAFNSGLGQVKASSSTTGALANGTVRETGLFVSWQDTGATSRIFLLAHDSISPSVSFVIGQFINVEYTWQI